MIETGTAIVPGAAVGVGGNGTVAATDVMAVNRPELFEVEADAAMLLITDAANVEAEGLLGATMSEIEDATDARESASTTA